MKDLIWQQQREQSLTAECVYCGAIRDQICVNPKTRRPLEKQAAHHIRLIATSATQEAPHA